MVRGQKPPPSFRESSPCEGCTEKFTACHGRCPKDERGEFGYSAWTAKCREIDKNRKEYLESIRRRKPW